MVEFPDINVAPPRNVSVKTLVAFNFQRMREIIINTRSRLSLNSLGIQIHKTTQIATVIAQPTYFPLLSYHLIIIFSIIILEARRARDRTMGAHRHIVAELTFYHFIYIILATVWFNLRRMPYLVNGLVNARQWSEILHNVFGKVQHFVCCHVFFAYNWKCIKVRSSPSASAKTYQEKNINKYLSS